MSSECLVLSAIVIKISAKGSEPITDGMMFCLKVYC
jgi:hypothetical protein